MVKIKCQSLNDHFSNNINSIFNESFITFTKRLFAGTVPANNTLFAGAGWPCLWVMAFCAGCWPAVQYRKKRKSKKNNLKNPENKVLFAGTVPANNSILN